MIGVPLTDIGWTDFFATQPSAGILGRVASVHREGFVVWTEQGEVEARVAGDFRMHSVLWPAVGDWVVLSDDAHLIVKVLERRSVLARKQPGNELREQVLAANIDILFIVCGLDRDFNPRRIERYLVLARQGGVRPVIVLNKADLCESLGLDLARVLAETALLAGDDTVLAVSAQSGSGLDALPALLTAGQTAALIGSSGAGKSTILNRLLGSSTQRTLATRASDGRGMHTTSVRQMFVMPGGWLLIDMPGLREIQLLAVAEEVDHGFERIVELAAGCRFRDCTHAEEPGCAVRHAQLDPGALENYRKLQREASALNSKSGGKLAREARKPGKAGDASPEKSSRHPHKRRP